VAGRGQSKSKFMIVTKEGLHYTATVEKRLGVEFELELELE
jgi:hypothetical protein